MLGDGLLVAARAAPGLGADVFGLGSLLASVFGALFGPVIGAGAALAGRATIFSALAGVGVLLAALTLRLESTAVVDTETSIAFLAGRLAERQVARRADAQRRLPRAWARLRASGAKLN